MSITSKQTYIARWCWAYVTRYRYSRADQIAGAQTQYSLREIRAALDELEEQGYIRSVYLTGGSTTMGYEALIPFVVRAPSWEGVL